MEFAEIMSTPEGERLYGDLAYWDTLVCKSGEACEGRSRIENVVDHHSIVIDRVMYGSDWFMLSRAHDWRLFPFDVSAQIEGTRIDRKKLFADNARRCFNL